MPVLRVPLNGQRLHFIVHLMRFFFKIGRSASAPVVIELFKSKCLPILLYAVEVCGLKSSNTSALQFAIVSCFMKIFNTRSKVIAVECAEIFGMADVSRIAERRFSKFIDIYSNSNNVICKCLV